MLVEYYLASRLGQLWLRLRPGLRARIGDGPGLCRLAATDRQIGPADLLKAQLFAKQVWWRAAMASVVLFFPVIGLAAAVRPGRVGTDIGAAVLLILGTFAAIAIAQMFILFIRSSLTEGYLRSGGTQPLDGYQGGYPASYDFWAGATVAVIIMAVLTYAAIAH